MKDDVIEEYFLYIKKISDLYIEKQKSDGSFPAGNNGPHGDEETPVRNTAHWLYTLCWLVERGFSEYRNPANYAANYLLSKQARPMNAAFWCRKNPNKDFSNGLIGQAWVIEALIYASQVLNRYELNMLALDVHQMHKWDDDRKGWHLLNVDGSYGPVHVTFNQQLWFAAVGIGIKDYPLGVELAREYLDIVRNNLDLYSDGVIYHDCRSSMKYKIKDGVRKYLRDKVNYLYAQRNRSLQRERSVGYHAFNLVALRYLKCKNEDHEFWGSEKYQKVKQVYKNDSYIKELDKNRYSYAYNPVAYEYGYFAGGRDSEFDPLFKEQSKVIAIDNDEFVISDSYDHSVTISRVYELCRMLRGITDEL